MTSRTLRLVLGDQLSPRLSSLRDVGSDDLVLMAEVMDEATYVRHHKQKIALVFAAMRHFAGDLERAGRTVRYVRLDDDGAGDDFTAEVERALAEEGRFDRVIVTEPGEWRLRAMMDGWANRFGVPVEIRADDRFVCSHERFAAWAEGRKSLRMEYFYRAMRREFDVLMDGDQPVGGAWNFDAQNRKALPKGYEAPTRLRFEPDGVTREVLDLVAQRFGNHFGDLEPFEWPVTRVDAERALEHFLADCLPTFGDYQDAMAPDTPFVSHSLLSAAMNVGLLDPLAVCRAAEAAYRAGHAPINAVEGFVRQILGWREYVRGIYWRFMPEYKERNALGADRALPDFYWTGDTDMACLADAIGQTKRHAYAHHIQRLMVTGNFAMLAGVHPDAINDWYMVVYADAFEWVELPNTHGMATFADGGLMASKPYAASGAYIHKMSSYCGTCRYAVTQKAGPEACPFNYLYWDFMMRHEATLRSNPRIGRIYATLDRMGPARHEEIRADAARFLASIGLGEPVRAAS